MPRVRRCRWRFVDIRPPCRRHPTASSDKSLMKGSLQGKPAPGWLPGSVQIREMTVMPTRASCPSGLPPQLPASFLPASRQLPASFPPGRARQALLAVTTRSRADLYSIRLTSPPAALRSTAFEPTQPEPRFLSARLPDPRRRKTTHHRGRRCNRSLIVQTGAGFSRPVSAPGLSRGKNPAPLIYSLRSLSQPAPAGLLSIHEDRPKTRTGPVHLPARRHLLLLPTTPRSFALAHQGVNGYVHWPSALAPAFSSSFIFFNAQEAKP